MRIYINQHVVFLQADMYLDHKPMTIARTRLTQINSTRGNTAKDKFRNMYHVNVSIGPLFQTGKNACPTVRPTSFQLIL